MIFGQPPIKPRLLAIALVSELTKELKRRGKKASWKELPKTEILKQILRRMKKKPGYVVTPNPDNDDNTQFLFDLVWWKNSKDMDIVLAVESELHVNKAVWH